MVLLPCVWEFFCVPDILWILLFLISFLGFSDWLLLYSWNLIFFGGIIWKCQQLIDWFFRMTIKWHFLDWIWFWGLFVLMMINFPTFIIFKCFFLLILCLDYLSLWRLLDIVGCYLVIKFSLCCFLNQVDVDIFFPWC